MASRRKPYIVYVAPSMHCGQPRRIPGVLSHDVEHGCLVLKLDSDRTGHFPLEKLDYYEVIR